MSLKQGMWISKFIKQKTIERAISELEEVIALKRAIPFKGEIPHRSQPGIMSGRYPVRASKQVIGTLKNLRGACIVNGFDLAKTKITFASVSWASRPLRRGGRHGKRSNIILKAQETAEKHG